MSEMLICWCLMNMLQVLILNRFCNTSKIFFIYIWRLSSILHVFLSHIKLHNLFFAFILEYMQYSIQTVSNFLATFFDTTFPFFEFFQLQTPYDLLVARVLVVDHTSGGTMVGQSTQNIHKWHESENLNKFRFLF